MIEFKEKKINIPTSKGTRVIPASADFSRDVVSANVVMNGFRFDYRKDDHHINDHSGAGSPEGVLVQAISPS